MPLFHKDGKSSFGGTMGAAMGEHKAGRHVPKHEHKDKHTEISDHLANAKESVEKAQMAHDGTGMEDEGETPMEGGSILSALGQAGGENSEA